MNLFAIILVGALGAAWGSFLNAVGGRVLSSISIESNGSSSTGLSLRDRSECFNCGRIISARDLIPLLSFVIVGGRSRCCKERLPPMYIVSEALFLCLFVLLVGLAFPYWMALNFFLLFSVLYLLVLSDLRFFEVPLYLIAALWICSASALALGGLEDLVAGVARAGFAFLLLFVPGLVTSWFLKRESLGLADPLVFAALAVYIEALWVPYFLMLSSIIGVAWWVIAGRDVRIPFLPAISIAFSALFVFANVSQYFVPLFEFFVV